MLRFRDEIIFLIYNLSLFIFGLVIKFGRVFVICIVLCWILWGIKRYYFYFVFRVGIFVRIEKGYKRFYGEVECGVNVL